MERGDIYRVTLDPALGREQKGYRPVLILSPGKFNAATRAPVVLPITTGGGFARRLGFAVALAGTKTTGIIRCDQPRTLDMDERAGHRIEAVPDAVMAEVLAKVSVILG